MKRWWQEVSKDYFTFSLRERNALLVLFAIALAGYLFSRYYPVNRSPLNQNGFKNDLATLSIVIDSTDHHNVSYRRYKSEDDYDDNDRPNGYDNSKASKAELFTFDPNTLDEKGWQRLGLHNKTIETLQKFLAKGFRFRQPEDLRKIYGLKPEESERLIPYVHITESFKGSDGTIKTATSLITAPAFAEGYKNKIININTADTAAFIALPGIGSKLANRIVLYRERLGGFVTVAQLGETYGLQDSVFQKIKTRLQYTAVEPRQININNGDAAQLKVHPYIKWNIANAIVNYRAQHGVFKSLDDLKKIDLINADLFEKLKPYIAL